MSKLTDLLNQARKTAPQLGEALAEELRDFANRRTFGLVFEQHQPENVELPGVHPQRGDKVHILPPRGDNTPTDTTLWQVLKTKHFTSPKTVLLEELRSADDADRASAEPREVPLDDVIVVAETGDTIYPGLIQTGEVLNGPEDAPAHVVINAENSHAVRMLTYTHAHSVDVIYIDPPYNTGAKDWKYNNDYVGTEDDYRHSKWLSFMQRRLEMAKQLLNPDDSVLIVTIDEREVHRLGMLLEQTFPDVKIQMVTTTISQRGVERGGSVSRVEEYIFLVMLGSAKAGKSPIDTLGSVKEGKRRQMWFQYRRNGQGGLREDSKNGFFPLLVDPSVPEIVSIGPALARGVDRRSFGVPAGLEAVWPLRPDGTEARWRTARDTAVEKFEKGYIRVGSVDKKTGLRSVLFINEGGVKAIESGEVKSLGKGNDGSVILEPTEQAEKSPKSVWNIRSHDADWHGSKLLEQFVPGSGFSYPKSLYAVEDVLRFFVAGKPEATVLDFFSGSGTTAHAVMRLNRQDNGHRRSISITNNEVSAEEQKALREKGLRPGDPEWEAMGICDYVTKPRVTAAITGRTPDGAPVEGEYKFTDKFDMAEGFAANARFFTLTYESAALISQRLAFERVAPLLWLRAGQTGRVVNDLGATGWDIADTYAVIENTDDLEAFLDALIVAVNASEALKTVFVITDDDRQFQAAARRLDDLGVDSYRLYASYLTNFEFTNGDAR